MGTAGRLGAAGEQPELGGADGAGGACAAAPLARAGFFSPARRSRCSRGARAALRGVTHGGASRGTRPSCSRRRRRRGGRERGCAARANRARARARAPRRSTCGGGGGALCLSRSFSRVLSGVKRHGPRSPPLPRAGRARSSALEGRGALELLNEGRPSRLRVEAAASASRSARSWDAGGGGADRAGAGARRAAGAGGALHGPGAGGGVALGAPVARPRSVPVRAAARRPRGRG